MCFAPSLQCDGGKSVFVRTLTRPCKRSPFKSESPDDRASRSIFRYARLPWRTKQRNRLSEIPAVLPGQTDNPKQTIYRLRRLLPKTFFGAGALVGLIHRRVGKKPLRRYRSLDGGYAALPRENSPRCSKGEGSFNNASRQNHWPSVAGK